MYVSCWYGFLKCSFVIRSNIIDKIKRSRYDANSWKKYQKESSANPNLSMCYRYWYWRRRRNLKVRSFWMILAVISDPQNEQIIRLNCVLYFVKLSFVLNSSYSLLFFCFLRCFLYDWKIKKERKEKKKNGASMSLCRKHTRKPRSLLQN